MVVLSERTEWILQAAGYLFKHTEGWEWEECEDYAKSLYETYVIEDPASDWHPITAVIEDMSYWGEG